MVLMNQLGTIVVNNVNSNNNINNIKIMNTYIINNKIM